MIGEFLNFDKKRIEVFNHKLEILQTIPHQSVDDSFRFKSN